MTLGLKELAEWMKHDIEYCDKMINENSDIPDVLEFFSGRKSALIQFSDTAEFWDRINQSRHGT